MTIGRYIVFLALYAGLVGTLFVIAHAIRGRLLLLNVWIGVMTVGTLYFFMTTPAGSSVPPWKSSLILAISASASAAVVHLRGCKSRMHQRLLTSLAAALGFALLWVPAAYVLR